MSWVLILTSHYTAQPPAVVGGYPSQEAAERAGELATRPIPGGDRGDQYPPCYQMFTVIPGAAASGPIGCTHSNTERNPDDYTKIIRRTYRYVEDGK